MVHTYLHSLAIFFSVIPWRSQIAKYGRRRLPILTWAPGYKGLWIFEDALAGLTVGLTAIPQGIAYGIVAGLDPEVIIARYAFGAALSGGPFLTRRFDRFSVFTSVRSLRCLHAIFRLHFFRLLPKHHRRTNGDNGTDGAVDGRELRRGYGGTDMLP